MNEECLQSLRAEELSDRERVIDRHTEGTCKWLLESPEYLRWIDEHGLLLIRGKPGSGKSTLLKFALEKEIENAATSGSVVLSFFFYASGTELQNGVIGLFRSLLLQLLDQDSGCRPTFLEICRKRSVTGGKKKLQMEWNDKELQASFQKLVLECSVRCKTTIFVDAVDECKDEDRDRIINFFHSLKGKIRPRHNRPGICFACRPYPDSQIHAEFYIRLEERNQHDIESFLEQELRLLDETPQDAEALKLTLRNKADGLFLWLALVIPQVHDMSGKGLSFKSIQSEILECPQELNDLYEGLLRRIDDRELREACSLFQWVCFSARQLSLDELRIAMNVHLSGEKRSLREYEDQNNPHWIPNETKMKKRMIHLSRGLVDVTNANSQEGRALIGFGHETIKSFLLKKGLNYLDARLQQRQSLAKNANFQLANTCLHYSSTDEIRIASMSEEIKTCAKFQFLSYTAMNWLPHAVLAEKEGCGEQIEWPNQSILDIWINVCRASNYDLPYYLVEGTSLMHIAAKYGLDTLARRIVHQRLPENKAFPIKKRSNSRHKSRSAFHRTAQNGIRNRGVSKSSTGLALFREKGRRKPVRRTLDRPSRHLNERKKYTAGQTGRRRVLVSEPNDSQMMGAQGTVQLNKEMVNKKDEAGNLPLHLAAESGYLEMVMHLIQWGAECIVNTKNNNGWTPLMTASLYGHLDVVKYLHEHGAHADIHTVNNDGWTPLNAASSHGHLEVVKFLYEHGAGADIHTATNLGWTPINTASSCGQLDVVRFLYKHGADADIHTKADQGWTPISTASACGYLEIVKFLYEHGADADMHTTTNDGWCPLHLATLSGHLKVVEFLYEHGADTDLHTQSDGGLNPLITASQRGYIEIVKLFLDQDVSINITNRHGWTPLHAASFSGWTDICNLLLDKGAVINLENKNGRTPLHESSFFGHKETFKLLLNRGADINLADHQGRTPLHLALHKGHPELVTLLLERGADVRCKDENDMTPVNAASYSGNVEVVKLLLENGADITVPSNLGNTPLYSASMIGNVDIVELLLEKDAYIEATNYSGWTSLCTASWRGHFEVIKVLLRKGADATVAGKKGESPLHLASIKGNLDVVSTLFFSSQNYLAVRDATGRTPLFYATANGNLDVVQFMLLHNADVNVVDFYRLTPFFTAVINGHQEILQHMVTSSRPTVKLEDSLGRSVLWWATRTRNAKIVQIVRQYAEEIGVTLLECDLGTSASSVKIGSSYRVCDVCTRHIPWGSSYHRCIVCYDFDICSECFEMGGRCLNLSHNWFLHDPDIINNLNS